MIDAGELIELDEDEAQPSRGTVELLPDLAVRNQRLDKYIAEQLPDYSRGYIQRLIDDGAVLVDGIPRRRTFKVTPGEVVSVTLPPLVVDELEAEAIPLVVVYEDADVLVIDKAAGMVVHPAPGHPRGTLVNALLHHVPGIAIAGSNRPGIVHRLDKDTSGLMVVAKSDRGRNTLVDQWSRQDVSKGYIALVAGVVEPDEATIDVPIGRDPKDRLRMAPIGTGRQAVSHFEVRRRFEQATLVDVAIETGRTHQIRVHLAFIDHPVVGDSLYNRGVGPYGGTKSIAPRQFLHAARLGFALASGRRVEFESALPGELQAVLTRLQATS